MGAESYTNRVWCETLPWDRLTHPDTLDLLCDRRVMPVVAVRPWDLDRLPALLDAARERGLPVALWPMIDDDHGRWLCATNVERFGAFVQTLLDGLPGDLRPDELALDLEPPLGLLARAASAFHPRRRSQAMLPWSVPVAQTKAALRGLIAAVHARGVRVSAAVIPMVLSDRVGGGDGFWQRAMGTPVDDLPWDHVSVMMYTSLYEGWSRGVVDREGARSLLVQGCAMARARYGSRVGASLGVIDTGALGDEPLWRGPDEMADDVALVRGAGIDTVTLFDLGGAVARGPATRWLDAFVGAKPAAWRGEHPRRARWLLRAAEVAARLGG